jgi:predicted dehydrogenase
MSSSSPIRLALIGAGIFARDAHVPTLQALGDAFEIVALCSRRRESVEDLAAELNAPVDITTDLDALLARDDIDAVDVVVPIHTLPSVVEQALAAGKHVISEKPVAPDVATGRRLLALYGQHADQVWMVAENWRYDHVMSGAAEIVRRGDIGRPLLVDWALRSNFSPSNKYFSTTWRRENRFPGGLLLDGGVHYAAALRMLAGEVASVSAVATQHSPDLPPVDTLSATLVFENGALGSFGVTYAAGGPWPWVLTVTGDEGALRISDGVISVATGSDTYALELPEHQGIREEFTAFAAAIRDGAPHHNTPDQAVQDVALVEAMLRAAETGQHVAPERIV